MNYWKKMGKSFCLGLAMAMAVTVVVPADIVVPPVGSALESGQNNTQNTGNQNFGSPVQNSQTGDGTGLQYPGGQMQNGADSGFSQNHTNSGFSQNNTNTGFSQNGANTGSLQNNTNSGPSQNNTATGSSSPSRLPSLTGTVTTSQSSASQGNAGTGAASGNTSGSSSLPGTAERPEIASQGAVLYDATHNQFLFEQNADTRLYPASITKLMTALLVVESCNLTDTVTFSQSAVTNLESGAVTLKVQAGDKFSVKDCLYGLLLKSANEIANGLAEHVAGSVSAFADRMNQKAAALGCTNTHFVNPNGLNNAQHYTTARDMALIAKAAFDNPTICQVASTLTYDFPATASVPTVRKLTMGHKMINPANAEYYEGIVGGKTGYTSLAGNTLVTCVERNGVRMIAVVLKSKQTHYADTKKLLDYGFSLTASDQNAGQNQSGPSGSGPAGSGSGAVSGTPGTSGQNQAVEGNRWVQTGDTWQFVKENGSYAAGECMRINGEIYCFAADSRMVTGWNQVNGVWYYFDGNGAMAANRWIETNGMWYYVDNNGSLFTGGTTPDGYRVDQNGVWVQ